MNNIKLTIAYDGTHYKGWQKTKDGASIEGTLQATLEQILQHPVVLQASSRTDAGVHAQGQVVNFFSAKLPTAFDKFTISLNGLLPKDIVVLASELAETSFHPTTDAIGKEYHYYTCCTPVQMPRDRFYSWHYHYPVDLALMQKAAAILCGGHDFSTFCNKQKRQAYSHYVREILTIDIQPLGGGRYRFVIRGNSFLHKMVRNLVGTLIYIGRGKIDIETLPAILNSKDRTTAGVTAPAHGLFLHRVFFAL